MTSDQGSTREASDRSRRTAIVTGGNRGMGEATARELAREGFPAYEIQSGYATRRCRHRNLARSEARGRRADRSVLEQRRQRQCKFRDSAAVGELFALVEQQLATAAAAR